MINALAVAGSAALAMGSPASAASIPASLHGQWTDDLAHCGGEDTQGVRVTGNRIQFYEAAGRAKSVSTQSDGTIRIEATYKGEGRTWDETSTFLVARDAQSVRVTALGRETSLKRCGSTDALTPADAFVRGKLRIATFRSADVDLNADGAAETIVYAQGQEDCGSGGCRLFVLTPDAGTYRVVTRLTVTRPPIRMLTTSTKGWRDLSVRVGGGGVTRPYDVRLRFDGASYPTNPTTVPASPAPASGGKVLID